ncbi:NAD-dependent epimerase/dehydratase family protein [Bordetella pseudohinzii]|uniref:Nucleotide sugar epimerase n=1 Tax=Bordetella pseudohinzii TaxID=1331258 RepID=A0A0J6BX86_9BORD|nr:NAD-dependent epimerase/dehydratase family protein [Bordetella pseudohinzii]ANY18004.1 nucleotide sugar epimerase [Bordetella pseudohinzii]KMM26339.1 nucleotide sugar epimerase [Bordetella pseudohinzii]KXA79565.1 nucleotide sugar epimerase [Bordetella pseudohinzii]KXA80856.1 nucleotide sugar epimerase [Bordetella pseudohinzii]CUI80936.1 dTDP-glucose 4%2C6-dehydratase [Bordetella pseudohinzii]
MNASKLAKSNVLVVGGAGFVGSNLVKRLLELDANLVHVVDNLLSAERINVPDHPAVRFSQASITDDALLASLQDEYDYVFHLSTYHGNQSSIHDPLADHENNTLTTLKLYERIKGFKRLKKVVYSAAGCSIAEKTFGDATATEETDIVSLHNNDSPYSMSKIFGEFYSVYYHKQHQLPTVRARFQNVYGPGEILGAGEWRGTPATVWRNVTPTFVYKSLKGLPLPLENGGVATRDFIFVTDVANGLIACAADGTPGGVYNIASGKETSIADLAAKINALTGNSTELDRLPKRPWDNSGKRFGSPEKAKRELGFEASVDIDTGLERTVAWTRDNLDLIEKTMAKHASKLAALG